MNSIVSISASVHAQKCGNLVLHVHSICRRSCSQNARPALTAVSLPHRLCNGRPYERLRVTLLAQQTCISPISCESFNFLSATVGYLQFSTFLKLLVAMTIDPVEADHLTTCSTRSESIPVRLLYHFRKWIFIFQRVRSPDRWSTTFSSKVNEPIISSANCWTRQQWT